MWMIPPPYVVLDIETIAGDPSDAEAWMRRAWSPAANWKAETIGSRWQEMHAKKQDRLALIDGSPILTVACKTPSDCRVLHWMPTAEATLAGAGLVRYEDERAMLAGLRDLLSQANEDTVLVGHNIRRFDLPRLRFALLKAGLRLPACLAVEGHPHYDTMDRWSRFTVDERPFVALAELLETLGLDNYKTQISGGDVGRLYEAGEHAAILTYAIADILSEEALFLRMTGQAGE